MPRAIPAHELKEPATTAVDHTRDGEQTGITSRGEVIARVAGAEGELIIEATGPFEVPTRTWRLVGDGLASDAVSQDRSS